MRSKREIWNKGKLVGQKAPAQAQGHLGYRFDKPWLAGCDLSGLAVLALAFR